MELSPKRSIKILDFDLENRPLSYWVDGKTTTEITAIASCWADDLDSMLTYLLGEDEPIDMLQGFYERYCAADIVTGHYIRNHDLPTINGALMEYGMPPLPPKLTIDTRLDMIKKGDIPASQEFLCDQFGIPFKKVQMGQKKWREANRLTKAGLEETWERVTGDVEQHMALRLEMVNRGLLSAPKVWSPLRG